MSQFKKDDYVELASWAIATVAVTLAVMVWGQSYNWQFSSLSTYQLFPLLGLAAYSLMWSHYVAGSLRRAVGVEKTALQNFLSISGYAVVGLILFHPGLLIWQLWRDGKGLPPQSYMHFVAPGLAWLTLLGTVSLGVFLAYELQPWLHDRKWWPWIPRAGNVAMLAIFYHGLRLGSQTQLGWYHWVWWFYGLTLVVALSFNYYIDRRTAVKEGKQPMKALIILVTIAAVVVLGAVGYKLLHKTTPAPTTTTTQVTTAPSTTTNSADTPASEQATITYSDNGFSPASLTVKSGTTVTVKNTSSRTVQFDSDPHPAHTDDKDLNAGIIEPGKSTTFVAVNKGNFGYHNHLDASETGTIIVQ